MKFTRKQFFAAIAAVIAAPFAKAKQPQCEIPHNDLPGDPTLAGMKIHSNPLMPWNEFRIYRDEFWIHEMKEPGDEFLVRKLRRLEIPLDADRPYAAY